MFKEGQNVVWSGKDAQGTFKHLGKVVGISSLNANNTVVNTNVGTMSVPTTELKKTSSEVKIIVKPEPKVVVSAPKKPKEKRAPRQKGEGPTKFELCVELYKKMCQKGTPSRQQVIEAFVKNLGMTPAGASTYASNVKKA